MSEDYIRGGPPSQEGNIQKYGSNEGNNPQKSEILAQNDYPQLQEEPQEKFISSEPQNQSLAGIILGNISVPPHILDEFFPWTSEITTTSNLSDKDIELIITVFEEFFEVYNMIIPERYKNRSLTEIYDKFGDRIKENPTLQKIKMLVNARIQLRKSRHGFLVDKLTTSKSISQVMNEQEEKQRFSFLPGRGK